MKRITLNPDICSLFTVDSQGSGSFKGTVLVIKHNPSFERGMSDSQKYCLNFYLVSYMKNIVIFHA